MILEEMYNGRFYPCETVVADSPRFKQAVKASAALMDALSERLSKEDYAREFRDTPFGLLVRKVAKLDHDAAMQAFSKFINDESLNAKQIAFVQKVIHYIEQNGYVESKAVLMKPPFDQPILFTRLFDGKTGSELMDTINSVKENATHVTA